MMPSVLEFLPSYLQSHKFLHMMMVLIHVITSPLTLATNGSARSVNEYKYPNKSIVTYLIVCGFVNDAVSNIYVCMHTPTSVTPIVDSTGSLIIRYTTIRTIAFPSFIPYPFRALHIIERNVETNV
jgi:hypothetical protein